ncbi:MAG: YdeI/OmpD-associated family protein, partial [Chloroflexota bacterium]
HQREYIKWVEEAKKAETRAKRIQKMMDMLKQGEKED